MRPYRHHVLICTELGAGHHCGDFDSEDLVGAFWEALRDERLDTVLVNRIDCLREHARAPIVIVYPDGIWYGRVTPLDVPEIVREHLRDGRPIERLMYYRLSNEQ